MPSPSLSTKLNLQTSQSTPLIFVSPLINISSLQSKILHLTNDITKASFIVLRSILEESFSTYRMFYGSGLLDGHLLLRDEWLGLVVKADELVDTAQWHFRYFEGCHVVFSTEIETDRALYTKYERILTRHGANVMKQGADASSARIVSHFIVKKALSSRDKKFIQEASMHGAKGLHIVSLNWIDDSVMQELACAEETYDISPDRYMFSLSDQNSTLEFSGGTLPEISDKRTEARSTTMTIGSNAFALTQPSHLQPKQYLATCRIVLLGYSRAEQRTLLPDILDAGAVHVSHYIPGCYTSGFVTHVVVNTSNQKQFTPDTWVILESFADVIQYQHENQSISYYDQYTHVVRDEWLTLSVVGRRKCEESDHLFTEELSEFKSECDIAQQKRRQSGASQVFEHIKFYIHKIESAEKYEDIEKLIAKNGGSFVSAKQADYAIVPAVRDLMGSFTIVNQEVTAYWVVRCVQERQLLPPDQDLLFKPVRTTCQNNFILNPAICSCDIHGEHKARLKRMTRYLEARLDGVLRPKKTHYLLCDTVWDDINASHPKYKRCIQVHIPIVKSDWIVKSLEAGYLIDPFPFMHPASQEQILRAEEKRRRRQQRQKLAELEEQRTLMDEEQRQRALREKRIADSYRESEALHDKRRKVLSLRNDDAAPELEILEYSPEEDELEDKREVPEAFKKHVRKRKRETSRNTHGDQQAIQDGTTPRKRRKRTSIESNDRNVEKSTSHEVVESHSRSRDAEHRRSTHRYAPHTEANFQAEVDDLLGDIAPAVDTRPAEDEMIDDLPPPAVDARPVEETSYEEDEEEGTTHGQDDDLESDSSSSQGSMDLEAFQQIIDEFPEIRNPNAAPRSSSPPVTTITRAELRANYEIDGRSTSLPPLLPAGADDTHGTHLNRQNLSLHTSDSQKDTQFHHSQNVRWKSGTQSATQYSSMVYKISISNEENREELQKMVEELGGEYVDDTDTFTHLAVGTLKKTAKIMCAIVSKTDILHTSWISDSYNHDKWLPPKDYLWNNSAFDSHFRGRKSEVSKSVRRAIEAHSQLTRPVFDGMRVNCLLQQTSRQEALLQILCRGGAVHTKDVAHIEYLFVSPAELKSKNSQIVTELISLLERNPTMKIVDMNFISKKVMNPEEQIQEITEKAKLIKENRSKVEVIESGTDDSSPDEEVTVVRTTKRIRRKRHAV